MALVCPDALVTVIVQDAAKQKFGDLDQPFAETVRCWDMKIFPRWPAAAAVRRLTFSPLIVGFLAGVFLGLGAVSAVPPRTGSFRVPGSAAAGAYRPGSASISSTVTSPGNTGSPYVPGTTIPGHRDPALVVPGTDRPKVTMPGKNQVGSTTPGKTRSTKANNQPTATPRGANSLRNTGSH